MMMAPTDESLSVVSRLPNAIASNASQHVTSPPQPLSSVSQPPLQHQQQTPDSDLHPQIAFLGFDAIRQAFMVDMYNNRSSTGDCILTCEEGSLKVHKSVLFAHSDFIKESLTNNTASTDVNNSIEGKPVVIFIPLPSASLSHLEILVQFLYTGQLNFQRSAFSGVVKIAEQLKIKLIDESKEEISAIKNSEVVIEPPEKTGNSDLQLMVVDEDEPNSVPATSSADPVCEPNSLPVVSSLDSVREPMSVPAPSISVVTEPISVPNVLDNQPSSAPKVPQPVIKSRRSGTKRLSEYAISDNKALTTRRSRSLSRSKESLKPLATPSVPKLKRKSTPKKIFPAKRRSSTVPISDEDTCQTIEDKDCNDTDIVSLVDHPVVTTEKVTVQPPDKDEDVRKLWCEPHICLSKISLEPEAIPEPEIVSLSLTDDKFKKFTEMQMTVKLETSTPPPPPLKKCVMTIPTSTSTPLVPVTKELRTCSKRKKSVSQVAVAADDAVKPYVAKRTRGKLTTWRKSEHDALVEIIIKVVKDPAGFNGQISLSKVVEMLKDDHKVDKTVGDVYYKIKQLTTSYGHYEKEQKVAETLLPFVQRLWDQGVQYDQLDNAKFME